MSQMQGPDEFLGIELAVFTRRTFPCDVEVKRLLGLPVFQLRLQPLQMPAQESASVHPTHDERPAKMQKH
eukprot:3100403-Amphidinium_carterae.1